jgi:hypothetical protein
VLHECRCCASARNSHGEVIAQAEHDVVPAGVDRLQLKLGEVRMLRAEEGADERLIDLHFGDRGADRLRFAGVCWVIALSC